MIDRARIFMQQYQSVITRPTCIIQVKWISSVGPGRHHIILSISFVSHPSLACIYNRNNNSLTNVRTLSHLNVNQEKPDTIHVTPWSADFMGGLLETGKGGGGAMGFFFSKEKGLFSRWYRKILN